MRADLPGVRLRCLAVHDGHAPAADDLHHHVRRDHATGVLIDAQAQECRVLGDGRQQSTKPVALLEVLVDDDAGQDAQTRGHLDHALLGRAAARPERDHVGAHRRGARACARDHGAMPVSLGHGLGKRRATDGRREPQLVAAGHEHARGVPDGACRVIVVRLVAGGGMDGPHGRGTQLREHLAIHLAGQGSE